MPSECHPQDCPIGLNLDGKVQSLNEKVREMDVFIARIDERLISIDNRLKTKSFTYPILWAITSSAVTGLVVYFISQVQK